MKSLTTGMHKSTHDIYDWEWLPGVMSRWYSRYQKDIDRFGCMYLLYSTRLAAWSCAWMANRLLTEGLIPTSSFLMTSPLPSIPPSSKDAHMTNDNLCHASSVLQTENESSNCVWKSTWDFTGTWSRHTLQIHLMIGLWRLISKRLLGSTLRDM